MTPYIIGIAGGTGSGKSTFTDRLLQHFRDDLTVIYHDNYYRRTTGIPLEERRQINYDHPDALETELLIAHLEQLRRGETVIGPSYDFSVHNRSDVTLTITPHRIIIVEGILVLQDPRLRELFDLKIYLDGDADLRILRRASRDVISRGRTLPDIINQYLTTVKPMHHQFVEPTRCLADIIITNALNEVACDLICTKISSLLKSPT